MNIPVKLVSYTRFDTNYLIDNGLTSSNSDLLSLIAYIARVSNPQNQNNTATSEKLIKYLIKHKHWSPFEMANVCMEINTTRDIAHQIVRHRSFAFQEFSQRYADPTKDMGFVIREARLQDKKNRQNSITTDDKLLQKRWEDKQEHLSELAKKTYNWAIEHGVAKEQARAVLPEGLTNTRLFMNGSIRSWIHFIEIRSDIATQKEHRTIALECANELSKVFPMIFDFVYNDSSVAVTEKDNIKISEWLGL